MNEYEFERLIDCRFPYSDEVEWKRLVELGRSISSNAHFITLDEICRPGAGEEVTAAEQLGMLHYWAQGFEHPLKDAILECAVARIERRDLAVERVLGVMDEISRHHRGQWGALVIALSACDDVDDRADARFREIKSAWEYDG